MRFSREYDSNIFRYSGETEALLRNTDEHLADTVDSAAVGAAARYLHWQQGYYAGAEIEHRRYRRFDQLDHEAWQASANWLGRWPDALSHELRLRHTSRLESFADRNNPRLGLQAQSQASLAVRVALTPRWRTESILGGFRQRLTLEESESKDLDEYSGSLGFAYTGAPVSGLGLSVTGLRGAYPRRAPRAGQTDGYHQVETRLNASYEPGGHSQLTAQAGYTQRENDTPGASDFAGPTGRLSAQYEFSGLSLLRATLVRRLRSVEEPDANFVEDSVAELGLEYRPGPKLRFELRAAHDEGEYEDQPGSGVAPRRDLAQRAELLVEYRPLIWLRLTPRGSYEDRDSNRLDRRYRYYTAGLDIELRYD